MAPSRPGLHPSDAVSDGELLGMLPATLSEAVGRSRALLAGFSGDVDRTWRTVLRARLGRLVVDGLAVRDDSDPGLHRWRRRRVRIWRSSTTGLAMDYRGREGLVVGRHREGPRLTPSGLLSVSFYDAGSAVPFAPANLETLPWDP